MERAELDRIAAAEDHHWWYRATRELARDQLRPWLRPGIRALDLGCGPGGNGAWLGEFGAVTGVDRSADALALLRHRHPQVAAVQADVTSLPFEDAAFDVVLALTVLYAVPRDGDALREVARVLRPQGAALFVEPAFEPLRRAHDRVVGTVRRYRLGELERAVAASGLRVLRATYAHAALLPAAAALAAAERLGLPGGSDLDRPAGARAFSRLAQAERLLLRRRDLPFGVSALVLATRPG